MPVVHNNGGKNHRSSSSFWEWYNGMSMLKQSIVTLVYCQTTLVLGITCIEY